MSRQHLFCLLFILSFSSCTTPQKKIGENEKMGIEQLGSSLVESFNSFGTQFAKDHWSMSALRSRITGLRTSQEMVLDYLFKEHIDKKIRIHHVSMLNRIKTNQGKAHLSSIDHFDTYSEVTILLIIKDSFDFLKYRIEIERGKPVIGDIFNFKDNIWYSENIKNLINLSSKYTAFSEDRQTANMALSYSKQALKEGDTLSALYALYEIPENHWIGSGISIRRLNLAYSLGDSIFSLCLNEELSWNKSLYMRYMDNYSYGDTSGLEQIAKELKNQTGNSGADTLVMGNYVWNKYISFGE